MSKAAWWAVLAVALFVAVGCAGIPAEDKTAVSNAALGLALLAAVVAGGALWSKRGKPGG